MIAQLKLISSFPSCLVEDPSFLSSHYISFTGYIFKVARAGKEKKVHYYKQLS